MTTYIYVVLSLFGLLFGSFLNVCIYRLPRIHLMLTDKSFAELRAQHAQKRRDRNTSKIVKNSINYFLNLMHFFGIHLTLDEEPIPLDAINRIEALKDQDYPTVNDFATALEEHIGKEQAEQYGDTIYQHAETRKESIVFPASHCPYCSTHIKPWDNIPVLSFLLLRGKCRACGAKISWRYPFIELLTALLFIACVFYFRMAPETIVYVSFIFALIVISFIDLDHRLIPNGITLPGILVGIIASRWLPITLRDSLLGAVIGGGVIAIAGYIGSLAFKKEAMGGGDVKLMAMIGAFLGWKMVFLTLFFGSVIGAVIGILVKLVTKDDYIPFGPFLSLGAIVALFFGQQLLLWYWNYAFPPP